MTKRRKPPQELGVYTPGDMETLNSFRHKYGSEGLSLLVEGFIQRSPPFKGCKELAKAIRKALCDLESVLRH